MPAMRPRTLAQVPRVPGAQVPTETSRWALEGRALQALSGLVIASVCATPLWLSFLPMVDLPQYVALSRMLLHLHDPDYGFGPYYELALGKSLALLPLYMQGLLAELTTPELARRVVVCASVAAYPLGLMAILRAQRKPIALALLGLPLCYASPFYLGLVPSSLSAGLGLLAIALSISVSDPTSNSIANGRADRRARAALFGVACALPLTHPFGVAIASGYVACAALTRRGSERPPPWTLLAPLALGALYWSARALRADGVAAFAYPSLALRLLRLPQQLIGGFEGRGDALLLGATMVSWLLFRRPGSPFRRARFLALPASERALTVFTCTCALGYLLLPSSTWTTTALHTRAGWLALALLPALVPAVDLRGLAGRAPALLLALGGATAVYTSQQLRAFDAEAAPFASVLAQIPPRPKLVALTYDHRGEVAQGAPYVYFAAYAQAERGGFLALSTADIAWTVPLRRRADAVALPPLYGSEWDPTLLQVQPHQFEFYDAVLVRGKQAQEMTIFMDSPFRLTASAGAWLLYVRRSF
jgi:hypothetical protein